MISINLIPISSVVYQPTGFLVTLKRVNFLLLLFNHAGRLQPFLKTALLSIVCIIYCIFLTLLKSVIFLLPLSNHAGRLQPFHLNVCNILIALLSIGCIIYCMQHFAIFGQLLYILFLLLLGYKINLKIILAHIQSLNTNYDTLFLATLYSALC